MDAPGRRTRAQPPVDRAHPAPPDELEADDAVDRGRLLAGQDPGRGDLLSASAVAGAGAEDPAMTRRATH
jgi:hypothetical protein